MKNKNSGFTLAEVLVAIVIGVISIAAAFSSYGYFNKSYKSVSQKAAINNSAREALSIITKDLRNTGYLHVDFTEEPAGINKSCIKRTFFSYYNGNRRKYKYNFKIFSTIR